MPMPILGITRIENLSLEAVNKNSSLVAKAVTTLVTCGKSCHNTRHSWLRHS
jgi:hypothetical protein